MARQPRSTTKASNLNAKQELVFVLQREIDYTVKKKRAGHAPEGSGVPVGTQYHWYIIAHQNVTKLNADEYSTSLAGLKFKLAHRRAAKSSWSASPKAQRKLAIRILRQIIADLEQQSQEQAKAVLSLPVKRRKSCLRPTKQR